MKEFADFQKTLAASNEALNLSAGDVVTFMCGYNRDILVSREVIGFDAEGLCYVDWDCWWFGLDFQNHRQLLGVVKQNKK